MLPLGEVLVQDQRYVTQLEPREYLKLSVKLYGKGVVLDTPTHGSQVKMARHQIARRGQVILSEIWGKKGAIGFVPLEGEGALCTSHFFLFDLIRDKVDAGWLDAIFRASYLAQQLDASAFGTTGYAAVRPKDLLAAAIPLPPLSEQQRMVARIETLAARIDDARVVHRTVVEECKALCRSILFNDPASPAIPTAMSELVSLRAPDVSVAADGTYHFAGVYCFGRGVFAGERKTGLDFAYKSLTRLRAGDFVYPKLMAWEGALGIVPPECDSLCVSPEYPVFSVNTERVLPEVLDVYFRSPSAWPQLAEISTGTNMRRRRLHPSSFLAFKMPLPPMETQVRLREVKSRLDSLADVQAQSAAELNSLLPSILDKAFSGEL